MLIRNPMKLFEKQKVSFYNQKYVKSEINLREESNHKCFVYLE
jgi:hypothetical protein